MLGIEAKMRLERDLRLAVATNDFRVEYQPIVGLRNGHVYGAEALLRWGATASPGAYTPSEFIAMAEETGLIVPLGKWVLEQAVAARAALPAHSRAMVNVNLSPRQLTEPDLVESIADVLTAARLDARRVGFEITETLALHSFERAARVVADIRALGCRVGIDDFGTGYASLSRLQRLQVDFIKVDRSFVDGLGRDRAAEALVAATFALARALRVEVVAEGVETEAQQRHLARLGCTYAQGFYFARPRPSLVDAVSRLR